jgi:phosphatidylserine/phosphatidylglycerophosphate/cardiolipin synthase-like enzyme
MGAMLAKRLIALLLLLAACAPAPAPVVEEQLAAFIEVFFSDPQRADARSYRGGPDEALVTAINAARASVDAALHDLNLWSVRDALLDAHARGVRVRLVVESDNLARRPELQALREAGIPLVEDRDEDRMHNKFVIIDQYALWTGSMNYTTNGAYLNRNDLLHIESRALAAAYTAEFEEMFVQGLFGDESPAGAAPPALHLGAAQVEVYFAPEDDAAGRLVALIAGAEESVYFMAYSFTDDIAAALIAAAERGLEVRGVLDRGQVASNTGGEYANLRQAGIDVRLDGEPGNLHSKLMIIDGRIVVTGSYNFSRNAAERNDENVLFIWDAALAAQYTQEFETVWALSLPPQ